MLSDVKWTPTKSWLETCLNPCSNGICSLTRLLSTVLTHQWGLNPCSNGICSLTHLLAWTAHSPKSLNPCSNGICSLTKINGTDRVDYMVLILVLMEYAL